MRRVVQPIQVTAMIIPIFCVGVFVYWWAQNTFTKSTEVSGLQLSKSEYMAGEIVRADYFVTRHRDCRLEIIRILERVSDKRDVQIQTTTQLVRADDPPIKRPAAFKAQLPIELSSGYYDLYSRVRFFCNGLDYLVPRYMTTPRVRIYIKAIV